MTIKRTQRPDFADDVANFVVSFGAVINMDGTAIYEAVAAISMVISHMEGNLGEMKLEEAA